MDEKKISLKDDYNYFYEAGKKFLADDKLVEAKKAFRKAAFAAGTLMKTTSAMEQVEYRAKALDAIEMFDRIDAKIKEVQPEKPVEETETKEVQPISLEEAFIQLDGLVGLTKIKKQIKKIVEDIQRDQKEGVERTYHMVFSGNPGTGKDTVIELLSQMLRSLGVVSKGGFRYVERQDLVAGYVGQTEIKTKGVLESAKGGVLGLGQPYLLWGGPTDFGNEAINVLVEHMSSPVKDPVIIFEGFKKDIDNFLKKVPALKKSISYRLHFPDYTPDELYQIFASQCKKMGYVMTSDASDAMKRFFEEWFRNEKNFFGNARDVRNLFNCVDAKHDKRVIAMGRKATEQDEQTITRDDLLSVAEARKLLNY